MPYYFHYTEDFKLRQRGESVKLYGYKKVNNRRTEGVPNTRHDNIVKSNLNEYVSGILYDISDEDATRFDDSKEVEKIDVSVTRENDTTIDAFTFQAKPKWTFSDGREKTDADVNLTGQLQGSDKGVQANQARMRQHMEHKHVLKYSDFLNEDKNI